MLSMQYETFLSSKKASISSLDRHSSGLMILERVKEAYDLIADITDQGVQSCVTATSKTIHIDREQYLRLHKSAVTSGSLQIQIPV